MLSQGVTVACLCPRCKKESDPPLSRLLRADYRCIDCFKEVNRIYCQQRRARKQRKRECKAYTPDEIEQLKAGAKSLPGRTLHAIRTKRGELGLNCPLSPRFTAGEDAIIRRFYPKLDARQVSEMLVGRTEYSVWYRAGILGVRGKSKGWKYAREARNRSRRVGASVTYEQIELAVSRKFPAQVRQEVVQSLNVQALEGKLMPEDLPKAVKKQITSIYAMFPHYGAPQSLDAPLYEDGKTTLGESISSDTFHF